MKGLIKSVLLALIKKLGLTAAHELLEELDKWVENEIAKQDKTEEVKSDGK